MDFDLFELEEIGINEDTEEELGSTATEIKSFDALSESTIIPKEGNFLGLDISQNSSGICLYKNGEKFVYNSSLVYEIGNPHAEALLRKHLKEDLLEAINGVELDLVVIEDVFEGSNADIVRRLYALNTAIDDLILEGKVVCKKFVRVANGTWKSWLSVVDTQGEYKGYNDKERVQRYLGKLGVFDEGEGFQDRLDATGMVLGYFLSGFKTDKIDKIKKKTLRVSIDDIEFAFEEDPDLVTSSAFYTTEDTNVIFINDNKLSVKKILDYMSQDISALYITRKPIRIGLLASKFNLDVLDDGGYFGFWLPDKVKKKYKKRLERLNM